MQLPERCHCKCCVVCLVDARVRNEELRRSLEANKSAVNAYLARKRREQRIEQLKFQRAVLNSRLKRIAAPAEQAVALPLRLSSVFAPPPPPSQLLAQLRSVIAVLKRGALTPPAVALNRFSEMENELALMQQKHVQTIFALLPLEILPTRDILVVNMKIPAGSIEKLSIPPERLSCVLGYAVHYLQLLAFVLDVVLPFEMTYCCSTSTIAPRGSQVHYPLYPKDKAAMKKAMTMLGLNVSALCYSQGLVIPMERIGEIFANLITLKLHPSLGRSEGPVMNFDVSSLLDPSHEDDISAIDERREWAFLDS